MHERPQLYTLVKSKALGVSVMVVIGLRIFPYVSGSSFDICDVL